MQEETRGLKGPDAAARIKRQRETAERASNATGAGGTGGGLQVRVRVEKAVCVGYS